jgi:hypothetical protein
MKRAERNDERKGTNSYKRIVQKDNSGPYDEQEPIEE